VRQRISRCSTRSIQNAGSNRRAHNAIKHPTYASACTKPLLQAYHLQLAQCGGASAISPETHHDAQESEGERERERKRERELASERARSKHPTYASVHNKLLLQSHRSQLTQCARTLRGDRFFSLAFMWVHGASMIHHALAGEHTVSRGCTRQHAVAHDCSASLHCCPLLRLLAPRWHLYWKRNSF